MKKIFFISGFIAFVILSVTLFQSCCGDNEPRPVGVIQFDSINQEVITGYDWSLVDTAGGLTTIPLGFKSSSGGHYNPVFKEKEVKWIEAMLLTFQKQYKVKITGYQTLFTVEMTQAYITVFFQPAVDPKFQKLETAYQESIDQNQELNDLIDDLSASNKQMKKEFQKLKKVIEEKK